uniref:Deadbeat, isoform B n=1 Tax=Drosophila melanogaster TaxID=7227 RepID=A2VEN4_DROME|eukprot:NP_001137864.1 deadbeat, isoform B [Drosophila melanogaster]
MARSQSKMIRAAMVVDDPNMVAWLPYLNFLRFLKRNFYPRTDLRRLLQVGLIRWIALSDAQKRLFEPERILARVARRQRNKRRRRLLRRARHGQKGRGAVRRPIYDSRPKPRRRKPK